MSSLRFRGASARLLAACLPALLAAPLLASLGAGCGSTVVLVDEDEREDAGAGGGPGPDGGPPTADAGTDPLEEYVDPGCGEPKPPNYDFECDPFDQGNGHCAPGLGCYIYVVYPDEPCEQETYGSICVPEGSGGQGDPCFGANDCAGGFACVVTGSGDQCVELCPLEGDPGCPAGLVCEPIDVEGFGGCL